MTYNILRFDEVDSTNALCRRLALDGAREGLVIVAATQTGGRGRLDRKWLSPRGGLWFSLLLRPQLAAGDAHSLTMAAAVALAGSVREATGAEARLKWPNDCLVAERKVAGILAEGRFAAPADTFVVLGVGINVNNVFDETARRAFIVPPASLNEILGRAVGLDPLLERFLSRFDGEYANLMRGLRAPLADRWTSMSATLGRKIRICAGAADTPPVEGIAEKIDDDFTLLVRVPDGLLVRVAAGDCFHANSK